MSLTLTPISPLRLHDIWETVEADLDVCRKQDQDEVWMEDIYHALKAGYATLYVGYMGEEYAGALVLMQKNDPWSGEPSVHIWFVANHAGHDILKEGQLQVEQIARKIGASKITLRAKRRAMERLLKDLGYEFLELELVKELNYG